MTPLSDKELDEFIHITKEVTGKDITRAEALEQGTRLLNMMQAIYRPIPKDKDSEGKN